MVIGQDRRRTVPYSSREPLASCYGGLQAWFDISDLSSLVYDGSNRVSLVADKSGRSNVNCLCCDGTVSNSASVPDSAALSITGDIDIAVRVRCPAWQSATTKVLLAKDSSGQRSFAFYGNPGNPGKLIFGWSADGSAFNASVSTAVVPFANYEAGWVRVTFATSTGTATFYTAPDSGSVPSAWTQLGSAVVTGATSIFDSTTALRVGNDGFNSNCLGNFFRAIVKNGIGGSTVLDIDFTGASKLATSFVCTTGQTVTINTSGATGARICGERDLYQGTVANQPVLTVASDGRHYLTFDGSNDYLKAAPFSLSQPETVHLVGSQVSWTNNDAAYDGNTTDSLALYQTTNGLGASPRVKQYGGAFGGALDTWALQTPALVSTLFSGAASLIRQNRQAPVLGSAGTTAAGGFTLGANGGGGGTGNITASEIAIYSAAHSPSLLDRFAAYALLKWRLTDWPN
jgi:hypothetical protein